MHDYAVIERRMRLLVASLKDVLPDKQANQVLFFVNHVEYGVALEELKYIYDKSAKPPVTDVLKEMFDLAKIMKINLK
jgi:hypothetical protein